MDRWQERRQHIHIGRLPIDSHDVPRLDMAQKILRRLGTGSLIPSLIVVDKQLAGVAHAGHADTVGRSQQDPH
ncbi:hypothetical protein D3C77_680330 [compost metagenome]